MLEEQRIQVLWDPESTATEKDGFSAELGGGLASLRGRDPLPQTGVTSWRLRLSGDSVRVGVCSDEMLSWRKTPGNEQHCWVWAPDDGVIYNQTTTEAFSSNLTREVTSDSIVEVVFDADAGRVSFLVDGEELGGHCSLGNGATGSEKVFYPLVGGYSGSVTSLPMPHTLVICLRRCSEPDLAEGECCVLCTINGGSELARFRCALDSAVAPLRARVAKEFGADPRFLQLIGSGAAPLRDVDLVAVIPEGLERFIQVAWDPESRGTSEDGFSAELGGGIASVRGRDALPQAGITTWRFSLSGDSVRIGVCSDQMLRWRKTPGNEEQCWVWAMDDGILYNEDKDATEASANLQRDVGRESVVEVIYNADERRVDFRVNGEELGGHCSLGAGDGSEQVFYPLAGGYFGSLSSLPVPHTVPISLRRLCDPDGPKGDCDVAYALMGGSELARLPCTNDSTIASLRARVAQELDVDRSSLNFAVASGPEPFNDADLVGAIPC